MKSPAELLPLFSTSTSIVVTRCLRVPFGPNTIGTIVRFGSGGCTTVFSVFELSSSSVSLTTWVESANAVPVTVVAVGNVYSIVTVVLSPGARPLTVFVNGFARRIGRPLTMNVPAGTLPVLVTLIVAIAGRPCTTDSVGSDSTGCDREFFEDQVHAGGSTVIGRISRLFASFVSETALPVSTSTTAS